MANFNLFTAWMFAIGYIFVLIYFVLRNRSRQYRPKRPARSSVQELALALTRMSAELNRPTWVISPSQPTSSHSAHSAVIGCP